MSVRYPIAASADEALKAPKGRAAREREAEALAGHEVVFAREFTGPLYATRAAAEQAFAGRAAAEQAFAGRVDQEGAPSVPPEDRFCELMEVVEAEPKASAGGQAEPTFEEGQRWPRPRRLLKTVWRLSVGYWKISDRASEPELPQAREARRLEEAQTLDAAQLRALAGQRLEPVKPQQPLDIGLFEYSPPEAPHRTIPDE